MHAVPASDNRMAPVNTCRYSLRHMDMFNSHVEEMNKRKPTKV